MTDRPAFAILNDMDDAELDAALLRLGVSQMELQQMMAESDWLSGTGLTLKHRNVITKWRERGVPVWATVWIRARLDQLDAQQSPQGE